MFLKLYGANLSFKLHLLFNAECFNISMFNYRFITTVNTI